MTKDPKDLIINPNSTAGPQHEENGEDDGEAKGTLGGEGRGGAGIRVVSVLFWKNWWRVWIAWVLTLVYGNRENEGPEEGEEDSPL